MRKICQSFLSVWFRVFILSVIFASPNAIYVLQSAVAAPSAPAPSDQPGATTKSGAETLSSANPVSERNRIPWFGRYWIDLTLNLLQKRDNLVLNLLPIGIGFIQAWIYVRQTSIMQGQMNMSRIQMEIQKEQDLFNRQYNVLTQRARLSFHTFDDEPVHVAPGQMASQWMVTIKWKNHGLTDAENVRTQMLWSKDRSTLELELSNSHVEKRDHIPPQHEIFLGPHLVQLLNVGGHGDIIYCGISIYYQDIFKFAQHSSQHLEQRFFRVSRSSTGRLSYVFFNINST